MTLRITVLSRGWLWRMDIPLICEMLQQRDVPCYVEEMRVADPSYASRQQTNALRPPAQRTSILLMLLNIIPKVRGVVEPTVTDTARSVLLLGKSSERPISGAWRNRQRGVDNSPVAPTPFHRPPIWLITNGTTIEHCQAKCLSSNYGYAGPEYSKECCVNSGILWTTRKSLQTVILLDDLVVIRY
ncbi:hypothetical protein N431DRAFT_455847 [Stipitochalara longipes BDJ]|nr:hypothetical protein N431DRAFT_455847 [Stipitochalara longipes BDJ]